MVFVVVVVVVVTDDSRLWGVGRMRAFASHVRRNFEFLEFRRRRDAARRFYLEASRRLCFYSGNIIALPYTEAFIHILY